MAKVVLLLSFFSWADSLMQRATDLTKSSIGFGIGALTALGMATGLLQPVKLR